LRELTTEASTEKLDEVLDFIDAELEAMGCGMKTVNQINLAVEEIFVNIAHYAYDHEGGRARITVTEKDGSAEITFADRGTPYNPLERPDPDVTLSAEERKIGGLGIFLVKKIMDTVSYEYKDGCNVLTMSKKCL